MFERTKQKASKVKNWVVEHKTDVAYFTGCAVGAVLTAVVIDFDNKCKRENARNSNSNVCNLLAMRNQADREYGMYGNMGPTVGGLSDYITDYGVPEDEQVIGALVYTKKQ